MVRLVRSLEIHLSFPRSGSDSDPGLIRKTQTTQRPLPSPTASWVWLLALHPPLEAGVRTHFQSRGPTSPGLSWGDLPPALSPDPRTLHERRSSFSKTLAEETTQLPLCFRAFESVQLGLAKKMFFFENNQEFGHVSVFPTSDNPTVRIYYLWCLSAFQGNILHPRSLAISNAFEKDP